MPPHSSSAADVPGDGDGPGEPPPVRQALSNSVYESIKAMVMDHEIAPGARVGIDALSRTFSVSPTDREIAEVSKNRIGNLGGAA